MSGLVTTCTYCGLEVPFPADLEPPADGPGLVTLNCPDAACGKQSQDIPHVPTVRA